MLALSLELETRLSLSATINSYTVREVAEIGSGRYDVIELSLSSVGKGFALPTSPGAELLVPVKLYIEDGEDEVLALSTSLPFVAVNCAQALPDPNLVRLNNLNHEPISFIDGLTKTYTYTAQLDAGKAITDYSTLMGETVTRFEPIVGGSVVVRNYLYGSLAALSFAKAVIPTLDDSSGLAVTLNDDDTGALIGSGFIANKDQNIIITCEEEEVIPNYDNVDEDEYAIVAIAVNLISGAVELAYGESNAIKGSVGDAPWLDEDDYLNLASIIITKSTDEYGITTLTASDPEAYVSES